MNLHCFNCPHGNDFEYCHECKKILLDLEEKQKTIRSLMNDLDDKITIVELLMEELRNYGRK